MSIFLQILRESIHALETYTLPEENISPRISHIYVYVYCARISLVALRRAEAFVNHRPPPLASNIAAERFFNKLNAFFLGSISTSYTSFSSIHKKKREKKNILWETPMRFNQIHLPTNPVSFRTARASIANCNWSRAHVRALIYIDKQRKCIRVITPEQK